jgi:acyl-CoA thioesterase-1
MPWPAVRTWLFTVALALTVTLGGCKDKPRHAALPQGTTVLALGDSLTYGTGATRDTSYPALLALVSGWQVVNAGLPGEIAAQGCERLPALIEEHRPQLVLVLLGGNDFLRRMPERGVIDALHRCVESARSSSVAVALLPMPRFGISGIANAPLYEEVGRAWDVPVLESGLASLLAQSAT